MSRGEVAEVIGRVWDAFLDRDIAYYPRKRPDSQSSGSTPAHTTQSDLTIATPTMIKNIQAALPSLDSEINAELIREHIDRCRESLDEVKQLTEYQDQKATRLLTTIAILGALSGVLFSKFIESYPLRQTWSDEAGWWGVHNSDREGRATGPIPKCVCTAGVTRRSRGPWPGD